eukprot:6191856-Pleurochrysis_carterae.AAC.2
MRARAHARSGRGSLGSLKAIERSNSQLTPLPVRRTLRLRALIDCEGAILQSDSTSTVEQSICSAQSSGYACN